MRTTINLAYETTITRLKNLDPHVLGSNNSAIRAVIGVAILEDQLHEVTWARGKSIIV